MSFNFSQKRPRGIHQKNLTSQLSGGDYMLHFLLEIDDWDLFETFGILHETTDIHVLRIKKCIPRAKSSILARP